MYALRKNETGYYNVAIGYSANEKNVSGHHNTAVGANALVYNNGSLNIAIGYSSMYGNKNGSRNIAIGNATLGSLGSDNIAIGQDALAFNLVSGNTAIGTFCASMNEYGTSLTAIGYGALCNNRNTSNNVAVGDSALYNNGPSTCLYGQGECNTAVGAKALYNNTFGSQNTAIGLYSSINNTTGHANTALGYYSLHNLTNGLGNTILGAFSYPTGSISYDNFTGVGYSVGTSVSDPSNRVEIGNTSVTWIGGQVEWSTYSDKRIKDNIKEDVPGLDFILKLKPVTYNLNIHRQNKMLYGEKAGKMSDWEKKYDIEQKRMTGFLAQDVAKAAHELNYEFSGVDIPDNDKDLYTLRYSEFVVPLVKAVQEQQDEIRALKSENNQLKHQLAAFEKRLQKLEKK
jgi:hypothetical protein